MNIRIDLIDGCSKTEEEMWFGEKRDLAAFKKKILIKDRTEIWLCSLFDCQDCNPAKYAILESWDILRTISPSPDASLGSTPGTA